MEKKVAACHLQFFFQPKHLYKQKSSKNNQLEKREKTEKFCLTCRRMMDNV